MKSKIWHYRVDRRQIGFVKFVLEACDGVATMSTVQPESGLVSFQVPPGCEAEVVTILEGLRKDVLMEPCDGDTIHLTGNRPRP